MSERHWLRNEIDFTDRPHGILGPWEGCSDACVDCNTAAQEIADSLALYNMSCDRQRVDHVASDPKEMEVIAKNECRGFYWHG